MKNGITTKGETNEKKKYYLIDLKTGSTVFRSNSLEVILKKYKKDKIEDGIVYMTLKDGYLPAEDIEEYMEREKNL